MPWVLEALPQHVWDDEISHMASSDVNLLKMRDSAIACGDGNIPELNVHVVLGYDILAGLSKRAVLAGAYLR